MRRTGVIGWVVAAGLAAIAPARAGEVDATARECLECHRPGNRLGALPTLAGQHAAYLEAQIARFRDAHRDGFPMNAIAPDLDPAVARAVAATLAAEPWPESALAPDPAMVDAGRALAARHECASCHGEAFLGGGAVPRLAGQNAAYLARQLTAFARGERHHPPTGTGARMYALEPDEVRDLAHFLATRDAASR